MIPSEMCYHLLGFHTSRASSTVVLRGFAPLHSLKKGSQSHISFDMSLVKPNHSPSKALWSSASPSKSKAANSTLRAGIKSVPFDLFWCCCTLWCLSSRARCSLVSARTWTQLPQRPGIPWDSRIKKGWEGAAGTCQTALVPARSLQKAQ